MIINLFETTYKDYLIENQSVSNDVQTLTNILYNYIKRKTKSPWQTTTISGLNDVDVKFISFGLQRDIFNISCTLHIIVYDWINEESFQKYFQYVESSSFSYNKHILKLIQHSINGKLIDTYNKPLISHELIHIFQYSKSNNINNNDLYKTATTILKDNKYEGIIFNVAKLIYDTTEKEIDAKANQLYKELVEKDIQTLNDALSTSLYKEINSIKENYNKIKNIISKYNFYNVSDDKLLAYIKNGINYMVHKYSKVINYYFSENVKLNETLNILRKKDDLLIEMKKIRLETFKNLF